MQRLAVMACRRRHQLRTVAGGERQAEARFFVVLATDGEVGRDVRRGRRRPEANHGGEALPARRRDCGFLGAPSSTSPPFFGAKARAVPTVEAGNSNSPATTAHFWVESPKERESGAGLGARGRLTRAAVQPR